MNLEPLISICIPAYNAQGVIETSLNSILAQDFNDYEIIIVDDGSDPRLSLTRGALTGLNSLRVKIVRQENGGTYSARQRAFKEAHGQYIICVDADDSLTNHNALSSIAAALENNRYPDVLLYNAIQEDGTCCVSYSDLDSDGEIARSAVVERFFLASGWNSMWTMAFRRNLLPPIEHSPRLLMAEDRLQKAEVFARAQSYALLDEPIYFYRKVEGSKMNSVFEPTDFYDRIYVDCRIGEMLVELGATQAMWAYSFNRNVIASLCELASDVKRNRGERIRLYGEFRDAAGCDEGLESLDEAFLWRDYAPLKAFKDRRWALLDVLLRGRHLISKIKRCTNC